MERYLLMQIPHKNVYTHTHTHTRLVFGVAHFQLIDSIVIILVSISCKVAARQVSFLLNRSQKT